MLLHEAMNKKAKPVPVNKLGAMNNVQRNLALTIATPKYLEKGVKSVCKK